MGKKRRLPKKLPKSTQRLFPNLNDYTITSPKDRAYNCIAFAAGDTHRKWDPGLLPQPGYYWPPNAIEADNDSIEALKRVFAQIGYDECENGDLEIGFQKVALYAIDMDDWLHAAIQEPSGEWSSKLGNSYDYPPRDTTVRGRAGLWDGPLLHEEAGLSCLHVPYFGRATIKWPTLHKSCRRSISRTLRRYRSWSDFGFV